MNHRSESFDLLRLIAALMVLYSHQFPLNGHPEPVIPHIGTFGGLGVMIFFALSGYLNCQSIFRSKSASVFLFNRALRIVPGVFVCSIFCIILGAMVTTYSLADYLTSPVKEAGSLPATLVFLIKNTFPIYRIGTDLPGVFADNHFKAIVNGSLWTLPYEVKCYLLLALVAATVKFNKAIGFRVFMCGAACLVIAGFLISLDSLLAEERLLKFLIAFSAGAAVAMVEDKYGYAAAIIFSLAVPSVFVLSSNVLIATLTGIACPILLIGMITSLPRFVSPKIDISYGVYIYAFPVQQTVSRLDFDWSTNFAIVTVSTLGLGILSAVLVERPALLLRRSSTRRATLSETKELPSPEASTAS